MTDARERMIQEIPSLRRYARFLVREADYADDLVQECLARAVANIERWQPGTNMKGWLVVMLRNIFINDIKRRRHRPLLTFDGSIEQIGGSAHGGQEERVHLDDVQRAFNRLTRDHVVPVSQGGRDTWMNVVAACKSCNQRKSGRTPDQAGMRLLRPPVRPTSLPIEPMSFGGREIPEQWRFYCSGSSNAA